MTTETTTATPVPPSMYPRDDWAPEGDPFYVEPDQRAAYAAAVVDIGKVYAAAADGKAGRLTWLPIQEAEIMRDAGRLVLNLAGEPISEDMRRVQVRVKVDGPEALHLSRLAAAARLLQQAERPPLPVNTCTVCGDTEPAAPGSRQLFTVALDAAARVGLAGMVCPPCSRAAALVEAEQTLSDGRTRLAAVREAAGVGADGLSRGERDRQAVMAAASR